jgi:hypothetical protein
MRLVARQREADKVLEDLVDIVGREEHDDGGRHDVLDALCETGDESTPRTESGSGEGVGAASVRHCR